MVEVWDKNVLKDAQIGTAVIDAKDVDKRCVRACVRVAESAIESSN